MGAPERASTAAVGVAARAAGRARSGGRARAGQGPSRPLAGGWGARERRARGRRRGRTKLRAARPAGTRGAADLERTAGRSRAAPRRARDGTGACASGRARPRRHRGRGWGRQDPPRARVRGPGPVGRQSRDVGRVRADRRRRAAVRTDHRGIAGAPPRQRPRTGGLGALGLDPRAGRARSRRAVRGPSRGADTAVRAPARPAASSRCRGPRPARRRGPPSGRSRDARSAQLPRRATWRTSGC